MHFGFILAFFGPHIFEL